MPKVAFLVTEDWYFVSHRLELARAAKRSGFEVVVITRCRDHEEPIRSAGLRVLPLEMNRRGLSLTGLIWEIFETARIYISERPTLLHHVALRPFFVGGIAAQLVGNKNVVGALAGMGFLFTNERHSSLVSKCLKKSMPWLIGNGKAIVQNLDDAALLTECGVGQEKIRLLPGAGVNTQEYLPGSKKPGFPVVMMACRLLIDKGVLEFVEAARLVNRSEKLARFVLVGAPDHDNPASVQEVQIRQWIDDGVLEAWGEQKNMAEILPQATIFCLPSYREGMPKVLLEAMACGLPCITTNAPGCRDAVRHEDNGLLVPIKDGDALAKAIRRLLQNPEERERMGLRGRDSRAAVNLFTAQSTERSLRSLNRFILGCGLLFAAAATLGCLCGGGYLSPVLFLWFTVGLRYALRDWTHPLWIGLQGWALVYIDGPCLWYAVAGKTINAAEGLPIDPVFMSEGGLLQAMLMLAIFYLALASLALRKVQPVHFPARNFVLEDKTFYRLAVVLIGLLGLGFIREIQFLGSSLESAPGLVNELIRFLFHDAAIFFALSLFNLGRLNGKNSQSVGWVQASLLVLYGGFFTAAGSKSAILTGLFLVILLPAACASFLGFRTILLPPFALLAAAVGLSPCLFMVGLTARLTIHQKSAVAGDLTGAWRQTLDSLGQVPDLMENIFYRISAEVNRYFLLATDFFQNDEPFRRLEYGGYIGKNLVNLFLPGTLFPEAYFMSSMFLPQLLNRSELISADRIGLVLQLNTQPLTLFGLLLFFFGYAAPAVFLLYAFLTQKVLFGRFPLVATGAFLFFFFSFSMYGLEAVIQRAAMFPVNLFIFLHLARWLCGKRPKLSQARKSLEP